MPTGGTERNYFCENFHSHNALYVTRSEMHRILCKREFVEIVGGKFSQFSGFFAILHYYS